MKKLMSHSFRVGSVTKKIASEEKMDKKQCEEAFIAGVLHDVGKLILVDNLRMSMQKP